MEVPGSGERIASFEPYEVTLFRGIDVGLQWMVQDPDPGSEPGRLPVLIDAGNWQEGAVAEHAPRSRGPGVQRETGDVHRAGPATRQVHNIAGCEVLPGQRVQRPSVRRGQDGADDLDDPARSGFDPETARHPIAQGDAGNRVMPKPRALAPVSTA